MLNVVFCVHCRCSLNDTFDAWDKMLKNNMSTYPYICLFWIILSFGGLLKNLTLLSAYQSPIKEINPCIKNKNARYYYHFHKLLVGEWSYKRKPHWPLEKFDGSCYKMSINNSDKSILQKTHLMPSYGIESTLGTRRTDQFNCVKPVLMRKGETQVKLVTH